MLPSSSIEPNALSVTTFTSLTAVTIIVANIIFIIIFMSLVIPIDSLNSTPFFLKIINSGIIEINVVTVSIIPII